MNVLLEIILSRTIVCVVCNWTFQAVSDSWVLAILVGVVDNATAFGVRRQPLEVSVQPEHTRLSNVGPVERGQSVIIGIALDFLY